MLGWFDWMQDITEWWVRTSIGATYDINKRHIQSTFSSRVCIQLHWDIIDNDWSAFLLSNNALSMQWMNNQKSEIRFVSTDWSIARLFIHYWQITIWTSSQGTGIAGSISHTWIVKHLVPVYHWPFPLQSIKMLYVAFVFALLIFNSLTSAQPPIQAEYFLDSKCSQPLSSMIEYPTYSKWNSLQKKQVADNPKDEFCVTNLYVPNIASGIYMCMFYPPLSSWSLEAIEFFKSDSCEFGSPSQAFTSDDFKSGQCVSGSYRNSSMSDWMKVYAIASCSDWDQHVGPKDNQWIRWLVWLILSWRHDRPWKGVEW